VYQLITEPVALAEAIEAAAQEDRYAIDTEFHRERTYFPQVALVQLAWAKETVLIDPLATPLTPLAELLDGPGQCIFHASIQDLEVLELACGTVPKEIFDTQIAAGFLGLSSGSLASLLDRYMNITLGKGDRLTDWLRRPLTDAQLNYAAADVDNLLELTEILSSELTELGRLDWALDESRLLLDRPRTGRIPEESVNRIKEARSLKGNAYKVAAAVAAWRERRAAQLDIPVRQVLPDLAVVGIAQRAPKSEEQLLNIRGLEKRHLRNGADTELLEAVKAGLNAPDVDRPVSKQNDLPRELRPVVSLVTAWISQLARDHKLDPALLATRSDVESLLAQKESRLLTGWRNQLVGVPIAQLAGGEAALAFDGGGTLVLEARSRQPLI
jgi:ribonuclease D